MNHRKHAFVAMDTAHIRNVQYLLTHDLIRCDCGYYGWIKKES